MLATNRKSAIIPALEVLRGMILLTAISPITLWTYLWVIGKECNGGETSRTKSHSGREESWLRACMRSTRDGMGKPQIWISVEGDGLMVNHGGRLSGYICYISSQAFSSSETRTKNAKMCILMHIALLMRALSEILHQFLAQPFPPLHQPCILPPRPSSLLLPQSFKPRPNTFPTLEFFNRLPSQN